MTEVSEQFIMADDGSLVNAALIEAVYHREGDKWVYMRMASGHAYRALKQKLDEILMKVAGADDVDINIGISAEKDKNGG